MSFELEVEHTFRGALPIRRHLLHNGLRVVTLVDHAAPIIAYQTWFGVGSRHEEPGSTGMAHLFEHLMFNQTKSLPPGEFDRLIERTGGDTNAATWVDWTYYRNSVPSRALELIVRLEAERMSDLVLDDEQLEAEREVVSNERLQVVDDDVDGFLHEELLRLAFTEHPYHWPTIGWMADIRSLKKDDVHRFYRTFYAPNNATIVLVGDFDEAVALDLIEQCYGELSRAQLPQPNECVEPPQREQRRAIFEKPIAAPRIACGYKVPGQGHPDWPVLSFIANVLATGPSARLYRRLVIKDELASSLDCSVAPFRDPSLLLLTVNLNRGITVAQIEQAIGEEIDALCSKRLSTNELDKVKSCLETDFWTELETGNGKAEMLGHYEVTLGDFRQLFEMAERFREIDADSVLRVARDYLVDEHRTVVIAMPNSGEDNE